MGRMTFASYYFRPSVVTTRREPYASSSPGMCPFLLIQVVYERVKARAMWSPASGCVGAKNGEPSGTVLETSPCCPCVPIMGRQVCQVL
jgi:hypothetical protein